ncbi:hypothetical protein AMECASPLE_035727 [Ameca splendens]|uniref:Uncharacterized protein n=1 Tax=Ameca splendens TaxID=208324 RepID=A0ABV0Z5F0_9TELE
MENEGKCMVAGSCKRLELHINDAKTQKTTASYKINAKAKCCKWQNNCKLRIAASYIHKTEVHQTTRRSRPPSPMGPEPFPLARFGPTQLVLRAFPLLFFSYRYLVFWSLLRGRYDQGPHVT